MRTAISTKFKARNSKQIQITKIQNESYRAILRFEIRKE